MTDGDFIEYFTDGARRIEEMAELQRSTAGSWRKIQNNLAEFVPRDERLTDAIVELRDHAARAERMTKELHNTFLAISARYAAIADLGTEILAEDQ